MMGKIPSFLFITLLLAILLPALTGCYTPAGRTAGTVIDDSAITTMVKAKLFESKQLSGFAISVKTFQGTVTLTGAVNSWDEKSLAEQITRSVNEVRGVNNLIDIKQ